MENDVRPDNLASAGGDAITPPSQRITELTEIIQQAVGVFDTSRKSLLTQILIWSSICLFIIIITATIYFCYFFKIVPPEFWTWQVIYTTAIKITFITALFFVGTYCFKMLSATFQIYQHVKHKLSVLRSLPSLIVASEHQKKEGGDMSNEQITIYNKVLDIIITFSNTGIIGQEQELKPTQDILSKILDTLIKLLAKK